MNIYYYGLPYRFHQARLVDEPSESFYKLPLARFHFMVILGTPGAYEVDWWSPKPGDDWEPVKRGEFADTEESPEVSHLA